MVDMAGMADIRTLDLTDPMTYQEQNMSVVWRILRAEEPVYWHPPDGDRPGFWVLSRHRDILSVYRDGERFTSERGNVLASLLEGYDTGAGRMLAVTDGRRHRELRNVLAKAFSPRVLDYTTARVRRNARALLSELGERGEFDFAREVAEYLPLNTICDLLGVPDSDRRHLLAANQSALSSTSAEHTELDAKLARNEILMYFSDLVRRAREDPRESTLGVLAAHRVDGEYLTDDDIALNCYSLILGGDETSRLSLISAVLALSEHPAQWHALRSGALDLDRATEEVLRWATPAMHFGRHAVRDVVVGDQLIKAGQIVTLWNSSANRDEEVFEEPDVFDLERRSNKHLSFGFGPHFCIGSFLARVEIRAVLEALRDAPPELRVTAPPRRIHSNFLNGYSSLEVQFS